MSAVRTDYVNAERGFERMCRKKVMLTGQNVEAIRQSRPSVYCMSQGVKTTNDQLRRGW